MSTSGPRSLTRFLPRVLAVVALAALGVLGAGAPALAAPAAPQLSIGVDDGQLDARSGATLRYTLTVTNLGSRPVRDLVISQTVPSTTRLRDTDGGTAAKGAVRWMADVPAGKSITLRTSVEVGEHLPADLFRLATVACAATSAKAAPTVCASDSDQLPAGAAAVTSHDDVGAASGQTRLGWLLPSGMAAGVVMLAGALLAARTVVQRRRPTSRRLPAADETA